MFERITGVFKLDVPTFEAIEHDQDATGQAATVVAIVALIGALGQAGGAMVMGTSVVGGFVWTFVSTFVGWIVWSAITFAVGTRVFGGTADLGEMLRVIGFAYAPQMLAVIPCLGAVVGGIWSLIAGFIAVRQGLDFDNTKAFLTIVTGFLGYVAVRIALSLVTDATWMMGM